MRITIEIDEKNTCKTKVDTTSGEVDTLMSTGNVTGQIAAAPPVELLKIANALGAESAGAAPAEFMPASMQLNAEEPPEAFGAVPEEIDAIEDEDAGASPEIDM